MNEAGLNGSGAPPFIDAPVPGGRGQGITGTDPTASGGGTAGLSLEQDSAWDVVAGAANTKTDLGDFLRDISENHELRAAATLRALDRLRDSLDRVPSDASFGDPVVLRVQDVALVARAMLSRLR